MGVIRYVVAIVAALLSAVMVVSAWGAKGDTRLVSRASAPDNTPAVGSSGNPSVSADGRYVAFDSSATNLGGGNPDTGSLDIFVRDTLTGETQYVSRASASAGNTPATGVSYDPVISADGRYVAFTSLATNLGEDADTKPDVFVRDLVTGTTSLVSRASAPADTPGNQGSQQPAISADGRYIAFDSVASNLGDGDLDSTSDVFVRDMVTRETRYVSRASAPANTPGTGPSNAPSISAAGRHVAFESTANNLGDGDTDTSRDVFVRDVVTGVTRYVSRASAPGNTPGTGSSQDASISPDGGYVAFDSTADNLGDGDADTKADVFVRDISAGMTHYVSRGSLPSNAPANADSTYPVVSAGGRYVAFQSDASNLGDGDDDAQTDVFVRDTVTSVTHYVHRASAPANTPADGEAEALTMSADGRWVAFESHATNLGDGDADADSDVFLRDVLGEIVDAPAEPLPPPPLTGAADLTRPVLTGVSLTNRRFRVAPGSRAAGRRPRAAPRGTSFRYTVSERATVEIAIERAGAGVRLRRKGTRTLRCVRLTRALTRRLGRRAVRRRACTAYSRTGTLELAGQGPGPMRARFSGRIRSKALKPARYRARLAATDAAGNRSSERRIAFTVVE